MWGYKGWRSLVHLAWSSITTGRRAWSAWHWILVRLKPFIGGSVCRSVMSSWEQGALNSTSIHPLPTTCMDICVGFRWIRKGFLLKNNASSFPYHFLIDIKTSSSVAQPLCLKSWVSKFNKLGWLLSRDNNFRLSFQIPQKCSVNLFHRIDPTSGD